MAELPRCPFCDTQMIYADDGQKAGLKAHYVFGLHSYYCPLDGAPTMHFDTKEAALVPWEKLKRKIQTS